MKCNDAKTLMSQIAGKSVTVQPSPGDIDYLSTNGYISVMKKDDYDQAMTELSNLWQMTQDLKSEVAQENTDATTLRKEEGKTHSFLFHLEGRDEQEAKLAKLSADRTAFTKEQADIADKDSKIRQLIQKKSVTDRMVPCDGQYLALTGLGVLTLNDLNVRNYRVSDTDFSDFVQERIETLGELHSIAERGHAQESVLAARIPDADYSQLWSVSVGLAKLQADQNQINQHFLQSLAGLHHFGSSIDNKMMAAEILTSLTLTPSQESAFFSDPQNVSQTLEKLEHDLRHHSHVPKEVSLGIAALIMLGRRFDGTFPVDRYNALSGSTISHEAAAILSVINDPTNQLPGRFQGFRFLFQWWGYQTSEDTELAAAYLAISGFQPDELRTKLSIIITALKTYLEYPLVAAAILASITTLEANETLDLMEKAYTSLWSFATELERSELVSIAVRMIHGIRNEIVRQLDPTATITHTPVQFTYRPMIIFFPYRAPLILAHSAYYSRFGGLGGAHPGHAHGYGGGFGG